MRGPPGPASELQGLVALMAMLLAQATQLAQVPGKAQAARGTEQADALETPSMERLPRALARKVAVHP